MCVFRQLAAQANHHSVMFFCNVFKDELIKNADLIGSSLGSHGDEGVVLLLQELSGLEGER